MSGFFQGVMVSFIIVLLCCLPIIGPTVHGASPSSSTTLGSRLGLPQQEIDAASAVAASISAYSNEAGYSTYNWYGSQTTIDNYATAAAGHGAPHSMSFYIGEGDYSTDIFGYTNYYLPSDTGVPFVYDFYIFSNTAYMDTNFAFLWACNQGDVIGGFHSYLAYQQEFGMPFAWLHTTSLCGDGYGNSDCSNMCFIGFHEAAPRLTDPTVGALNLFITNFYQAALTMGDSVNSALDSASLGLEGKLFSHCWLHTGYLSPDDVWSYMVVYGDGNMHLTPINALFAMKTRATNGWFYKPNQPVQFVKIEEWFTDSSAEGDQVGTSVVGYPFPFPNSAVSLADLVAVGRAYGTHEGDPNWSYQEDIFPNRNVDLSDLTTLANNYGKSGSWYSTDLSNVRIEFHFNGSSNQMAYPDGNGFVAVPWNCTDWTVYRQDSQIGAFLTFWG